MLLILLGGVMMAVLGSVKGRHQYFRLDYGKVVRKLSINVETKMHKCFGIFDTGAESIVFKKGLPERFGFRKTGSDVRVSGATGSEEAPGWIGSFDLIFDDERKIHIKDVFILEADLPGNTDVLLGQPIISEFRNFCVCGFSKVEIDL